MLLISENGQRFEGARRVRSSGSSNTYRQNFLAEIRTKDQRFTSKKMNRLFCFKQVKNWLFSGKLFHSIQWSVFRAFFINVYEGKLFGKADNDSIVMESLCFKQLITLRREKTVQ